VKERSRAVRVLGSVIALPSAEVPAWAASYSGPALAATLLGVRLANDPRRRRPLERRIVIYLLTVAISIWAAYDMAAAAGKASRLLIGVLLLLVVSTLPESHTKSIVLVTGLLGGTLAIGFSLWSSPLDPSIDFDLIRRARMWLSLSRENPGSFLLNANAVAGVLIFTLPVLVAASIQSILQSRIPQAFLFGTLAVVQLAGLFLTSSRGAWLSLLLAPVAGTALYVGYRLWHAGGVKRRLLILALIVLSGTLVVFLAGHAPLVGDFVQLVPGAPTLGERLGLYKDTLDLISDFAYTGGGLGAFSGLYSTYTRIIPYHYLRYSHNLYLDIALEQGVFGLLAVLGILAYALQSAIRAASECRNAGRTNDFVAIGSTLGLVAILIHGFGDDPLFGVSGTPLLFVPAALALHFSGRGTHASLPESKQNVKLQADTPSGQALRRMGVGFLLLLVLVIAASRILASGLAANLAALKLAKVELANWSGDGWPDAGSIDFADDLSAGFVTAIGINPNQVTALSRLGHLAIARMDYDSAVDYLHRAHAGAPTSRGVSKQLGYALLWRGEIGQAVAYLSAFRETAEELSVYSWWWQTQGETELSELALQASRALSEKSQSG